MTYSREEVHRRLTSPLPDERRVAAIMIGKARLHHFTPALIDLVQHDQAPGVRAMAAFALDMLGTADAIPALIAAMYDASFDVRSNAGWALVHLADRLLPQLVVPDVIDVLRDEQHAHARHMAYIVLKNIRDEDARLAIMRYW